MLPERARLPQKTDNWRPLAQVRLRWSVAHAAIIAVLVSPCHIDGFAQQAVIRFALSARTVAIDGALFCRVHLLRRLSSLSRPLHGLLRQPHGGSASLSLLSLFVQRSDLTISVTLPSPGSPIEPFSGAPSACPLTSPPLCHRPGQCTLLELICLSYLTKQQGCCWQLSSPTGHRDIIRRVMIMTCNGTTNSPLLAATELPVAGELI